jgi:hypothetical protein
MASEEQKAGGGEALFREDERQACWEDMIHVLRTYSEFSVPAGEMLRAMLKAGWRDLGTGDAKPVHRLKDSEVNKWLRQHKGKLPEGNPVSEKLRGGGEWLALRELVEWLEQEAEEQMKSVTARREMRDTFKDITAPELRASQRIAEQMAGRKLPKTTVKQAHVSAQIHARIAVKIEAEAIQLSKWADLLRAMLVTDPALAAAPSEGPRIERERIECAIAPSVTNCVAPPATGTTADTGTNDVSTWRTVIVGLPIFRKLLAGENVELSTLRVSLIPDDVLWNARPTSGDAADAKGADKSCDASHVETEEGAGSATRDLSAPSSVQDEPAAHSRPAGFGPGEYSCAVCGMGMVEPCEHWKASTASDGSTEEDAGSQPEVCQSFSAEKPQPSEVGEPRHHVKCACGWERFIVGGGTEVGPPSRSIFVPITDILESHANLCPKMKAALGAAREVGEGLREREIDIEQAAIANCLEIVRNFYRSQTAQRIHAAIVNMANAKLKAKRLAAPAPNPADYTLIPNSALRWLFGEEGDFVDPNPAGIRPRPYWWRSEFRRRASLERDGGK